ncbi:MAG: ketopantoate reductase family protein [Elusimicrobia bacterium]|nr:ketopantoate reductase family protein [Elusimicrobiota bacterium]
MRIAVVGTGVVGSILAGHLLKKGEETILVDAMPERVAGLKRAGVKISDSRRCISGDFTVPVQEVFTSLRELRAKPPDVLFLSIKACILEEVLPEVKSLHHEGLQVVSFQNGLGTEEIIADALGTRKNVMRVVINYAGRIIDSETVGVGFFNPPNHIGVLEPGTITAARELAARLSAAGLETQYSDKIVFQVWEKVILNASLCAISALTNLTIQAVMQMPQLRALAEGILHEGIQVAAAEGVVFPENFFSHCIEYLNKAGPHKPSMCADCENGRKTEIDFLNGMIAERGTRRGVAVPYNETVTALVKGLESHLRSTISQ